MRRITNRLGLALLLVMALAGSGLAQGSIFGTVSNANATTPANGEILFVGYLDNTDEEIRIESSDGAGYDAGNWFDDFQNYLTEAAGNPYDYHFYNIANGQGFQLSGAIPNNSFQQENVTLAPVTWPVAPIGLAGVTASTSTVILTWTQVGGLTYHVYRRVASSNGSFFRIDNPSGSLADPGEASNYFVDNTVSGGQSYSYIIIAQDPSGNFSPHSAIATVNTSSLDAPILTSLNPNTGTATGGTVVTVNGSGFDPAGATVLFGLTSVPATVVTPFQLTVTTPPGSVGAAVDVTVTNTASGLVSNTLIGGYIYAANATPVLTTIGPRSTTEGVRLTFTTSATDADGQLPIMTSSTLPGTATYVDNNNGTGTFDWTPTFVNAGVYNVTFHAIDRVVPTAVDSEIVVITVIEAGNQTPVVNPITDQSVAEGQTLAFQVTATDADLDPLTLAAVNPPANASFVDNGDNTGTFTFTPDASQSGIYNITFTATDPALSVGSTVAQITVTEVNQLPVLAAIGPQSTTENVLLSFRVSASDPDGGVPLLSTSALPGTAIFVDSLNGAGSFLWTPGFTDAGTYDVTFRATDPIVSTAVDSEIVTITILEAGNQAPALATIGPRTIAEGGTLNFAVTATDPDGTSPSLRAESLPTNATLVDNLNGTATFNFVPDFNQAGLYTVLFIAEDGLLADSEFVSITVVESGNMPPVFDPVSDYTINEGDSLVVTVRAVDPDGGLIYPILSVSTTLSNYSFVDNRDGTGRLVYRSNYFSAGVDTVNFLATDFGTPQRTTTAISEITTVDINQPPLIPQLGPFGVVVDDSLVFTVQAVDSTDPITSHRVILSALNLPANATFTDNINSTGRFAFRPSLAQVGTLQVTFLGVDQGVPQLSTTMTVDITVVTENLPPELAPIGPRTVMEGVTLTINLSASDPDGPPPALQMTDAPEGATLIDNGDGTGVFTYTPDFFGKQRLESVTFRAYDGYAIDKELVLIQIYDAGNQRPYFDSIPAPSVVEGSTLVQGITAKDPDRDPILLSIDVAASPLPPNASFLDLGLGLASITFSPDFSQAGIYDFHVVAADGPLTESTTLSDTIVVTFTVVEFGNHAPLIAAITPPTVAENATLTVTVSASDLDGESLSLWATLLPANATFTDNANNTGTLTFTPSYDQAGTYDVIFYATDGIDTTSQLVTITVTDTNRLPFVFTAGPVGNIYEMDTLRYTVDGFDADGTTPLLSAHLSGLTTLAANMTFVDNRDGTGTLTFAPDWSQGGPVSNPTRYYVVFRATDEVYTTVFQESETITIGVLDRNKPPELVFPPPGGPGPYNVSEGSSVTFYVAVLDEDAVTAPACRAENVPANAVFNYVPVDRIGDFTFAPDFTQAGVYNIRFIATDDRNAVDTAIVQITVLEAGNQPPSFGYNLPDTMLVPTGHLYQITLTPSDPEHDSISVTAYPMLPGASWSSAGDGTWVYSFTADPADVGQVYEITFVVTDYPGLATATLVTHPRIVAFLRGDLDSDNIYSVNDIAYFVEYMFRGGPPPPIPETADIDASGTVSIGDVSYLIYYMFRNGPQPAP
ncbi:MAG: Ig-like domain-containing protein [Candidatus Zixiibacteriota bacterium]